jgi:hypothetical protein
MNKIVRYCVYFLGIVEAVLIVLKLIGSITWPWYIVLIPAVLPLSMGIIVFALVFLIIVACIFKNTK